MSKLITKLKNNRRSIVKKILSIVPFIAGAGVAYASDHQIDIGTLNTEIAKDGVKVMIDAKNIHDYTAPIVLGVCILVAAIASILTRSAKLIAVGILVIVLAGGGYGLISKGNFKIQSAVR